MCTHNSSTSLPVALSIASSDSGCGAGIQADLLTFSACGVFGTTAIAALTAQNPQSVTACVALEPAFLEAQIDRVFNFFPVRAVKTGMLFTADLIRATAEKLRTVAIPIVVDPVMIASSGHSLLQLDAIQVLVNELLPIATLITPNLDEAEAIMQLPARTSAERDTLATQMSQHFNTTVLLKGGHADSEVLVDILATSDGTLAHLSANRIHKINTHGSGCTLAAAITAHLAKGCALETAVRAGHQYLQRCLHHPLQINSVHYINHSG